MTHKALNGWQVFLASLVFALSLLAGMMLLTIVKGG